MSEPISPETDLNQVDPKNFGQGAISTSQDWVTTALPNELIVTRDWSRRNGVESEFLLLADVAFLLDRPAATGSTIGLLKSDLCKESLKDWALESLAADQLLKLSEAVRRNPEVCKIIPPLSHGIKGIDIIRGQSEQLYLIGLLAARLPVLTNAEEKSWFEKLRLWLLVHAYERASNSILLDENLRILCTDLRLAHDSGDSWLALFKRLRVDALGFQGMDYSLMHRASRLLLNKKSEYQLSASEVAALKALERLVKREVAELRVTSQLPPRLYTGGMPNILARSFELDDDLFEEADLEDNSARYVEITGAEPNETVICAEVDPNETFARQTLSGKTVFLSSAEENQFLPWSWKQCAGQEEQDVRDWVEKSLAAQDSKTRLCAAILWVANATGRSVERALEFRVGGRADSEWHLSEDFTQLVRLSPRPQQNSLSKEWESEWILPFAAEQTVRLPDQVGRVLYDVAASFATIPTLGHLYDAVVGDKPRAVYADMLKEVSPRLNTSMFARSLPMRVFRESKDGILARVVASSSQTGRTGAMSYASWPIATLSRLLNPTQNESEAAGDDVNGMGSLIQIRDDKLREAFSIAAVRVDAAGKGDDFLRFCNFYVAYHVVGLLAYTGVRPVNDSFEQARHFDLEDGFAFVNDKVVDDEHEGRPVPVHRSLIEWVKDDYPRHLRHVASMLRCAAPGLAEAIEELAYAKKKGRLPFFFFLEQTEDGIQWTSVSEQSIRELGLFDWPMPLNFFRHRLATGLRKLGADPEVIDSLLGHSEAGSATHGDLSWRVWLKDMQAVTPALDALFEQTGFRVLPGWDRASEPLPVIGSHSSFALRPYGQEARALERAKRHRQARRDAVRLIEETLAGRTMDALSEDELSRLATQLVTTPRGMPHPFARLRWACLFKRAKRVWRRTGKRVRLKRTFVFADAGTTAFTEAAPGARAMLDTVRRALAPIVGQMREGRPGHTNCAAMATLLLLVESRVSDHEVLRAVSRGKGVRLARKGGEHFLEYSPAYALGEDDESFFDCRDPGVPVRRYRISADAVWLIERSLSGRSKRPRALGQVPMELAPVAELLVEGGLPSEKASYDMLLEALAFAVDQANQLELPGVLAGYLSGRVESYALEWFDWVLLRWGERRLIEAPQSEDEATDVRMVGRLILPNGVREKEILQQGARKVFSAVRRIVAGLELTEEEHRVRVKGSPERKQQQASIRKVIRHYEREISSATQALALWVAYLLDRKKGKERLATGSIKRYLSALAGGFESFMYDTELADLDEEDVTEAYQQLLESAKVKDKRYMADRLVAFHRWGRRVYGMEDPDWSQLEFGSSRVAVDAGVLLEEDYQSALRRLLACKTEESPEARDAALLLLVCYRFGLRGNEAKGLTRADWVVNGDHMVLIVRTNPIRKLKTPGSRRIVPLVFRLEGQEKVLIEERLMRAEGIHGGAHKGRIFCREDGSVPDWAGVKRLAISVLKQATGNPGANLHRARHAAANRILSAITDMVLPGWSRLDGGKDGAEIAQTLLGGTGSTRRAGWAVARFLGHTNLKTGLRSYLHCLPDIAEQVFQPVRPETRLYARTASVVIDLDAFPLQDVPSEKEVLSPAYQTEKPRPTTVLSLMRLLSLGKEAEQIVEKLNLDKDWVDQAVGVMEAAGKRIHLGSRGKKEETPKAAETDRLEYLRRIREDGWTRLNKAALEATKKYQQLPTHSVKTKLLPGMVGHSGELLMARDDQFDLVRKTLDFWGVDHGRYATARALDTTRYGHEDNESMLARAKRYGFDAEPAKSKKGHEVRVDFPVMDEYGSRAKARCAVFLSESPESKIRNRIELLVAFLALAIAAS